MKRFFKAISILPVILLTAATLGAAVKLPRLISDGMVLQRDMEIKVWGWADAGEDVSLTFLDQQYRSTADADGKWQIKLPALKAGGPYEMQISGSNTISLKDILIGDVWVCSGQSNMEMGMRSVQALYPEDIAGSENHFIRQFAVPRRHYFQEPLEDLAQGEWQSANPSTILRFSAAAYFFAKELYERYQIPIGLINATLGGSRAESWMSEAALRPFPSLYEEGQKFKDTAYIASIEQADNERSAAWNRKLMETDKGYQDPAGPWSKADYDDSSWEEMKVPGFWTNDKLGAVNGSVWYRREFEAPADMAGKEARLPFGNIIETDSVFINGAFVGRMFSQYVARNYTIPAGVLKAGRNTIAVRIVSPAGKGGFVPDKQFAVVTDGHTIDLSGIWKFKAGSLLDPLPGRTFVMWKATGLYKGMITPLLPYAIKGVIWYQGESNVSRAVQYRSLFPDLIKDWRRQWDQGDFPFLSVQLPNYGDLRDEPAESDWAMLREAQVSSLSLPNTGLAVTIDIGEWNDIHPLNKKEVGKRLALIAAKQVYGDQGLIASGPTFRSIKIKGKKAILSFDHTGSGLMVKGSEGLKNFAIAGVDKQFVWAEAEIKGHKVVVWNDALRELKYVRYAWADAPREINFYNKEGLPARPFRTDRDE